MTIRVEILRVFTADDAALGNELGVIDSSPATAGREQAIAAELGFSETVFVDGIDGDTARARIFTPARELPFAGHPTVGLAWHLHDLGSPVTALAVPAGPIAVTVEGDRVFVAARPEWSPAFDFVELGSAAEVAALDPDAAPPGATYYWAWTDERRGSLRSRMFAPTLGIREDEATGSAAVALTGRLRRDLDITQGAGCRLATRWLDPLAAVGGRTVRDRVITLD